MTGWGWELAHRLALPLSRDDVQGFLQVWDDDVPVNLSIQELDNLKEAARALAHKYSCEKPNSSTLDQPVLLQHCLDMPQQMHAVGGEPPVMSNTHWNSEMTCEVVDTTSAAQCTPRDAARARVMVHDRSFRPASLRVEVGTLVEWVAAPGVTVAHRLALGGSLQEGGESTPIGPEHPPFTWVFTTPGTFAYHSQIFTFMKGSVCVGPLPNGAPESSPPQAQRSTASITAPCAQHAARQAKSAAPRSRAELEWLVAGVRTLETDTEPDTDPEQERGCLQPCYTAPVERTRTDHGLFLDESASDDDKGENATLLCGTSAHWLQGGEEGEVPAATREQEQAVNSRERRRRKQMNQFILRIKRHCWTKWQDALTERHRRRDTAYHILQRAAQPPSMPPAETCVDLLRRSWTSWQVLVRRCASSSPEIPPDPATTCSPSFATQAMNQVKKHKKKQQSLRRRQRLAAHQTQDADLASSDILRNLLEQATPSTLLPGNPSSSVLCGMPQDHVHRVRDPQLATYEREKIGLSSSQISSPPTVSASEEDMIASTDNYVRFPRFVWADCEEQEEEMTKEWSPTSQPRQVSRPHPTARCIDVPTSEYVPRNGGEEGCMDFKHKRGGNRRPRNRRPRSTCPHTTSGAPLIPHPPQAVHERGGQQAASKKAADAGAVLLSLLRAGPVTAATVCASKAELPVARRKEDSFDMTAARQLLSSRYAMAISSFQVATAAGGIVLDYRLPVQGSNS